MINSASAAESHGLRGLTIVCRTCSWVWMACHRCNGTHTALWAATRATLWLPTSRHMASECFSSSLGCLGCEASIYC